MIQNWRLLAETIAILKSSKLSLYSRPKTTFMAGIFLSSDLFFAFFKDSKIASSDCLLPVLMIQILRPSAEVIAILKSSKLNLCSRPKAAFMTDIFLSPDVFFAFFKGSKTTSPDRLSAVLMIFIFQSSAETIAILKSPKFDLCSHPKTTFLTDIFLSPDPPFAPFKNLKVVLSDCHWAVLMI